MKNWSLKQRVSLVSSLVILLAFYSIYQLTKSAYHNANLLRIQQSLSVQIYVLMATVDDQPGELIMPRLQRNERLNNLNSDLVAYIMTLDGEVIWRSISSESHLESPSVNANYSLDNVHRSAIDGEAVYWIGDTIIWEFPNEVEKSYLFLVGEKEVTSLNQANKYNQIIASWLAVSSMLLIVILLLALHFALRPLSHAQKQIELVSRGKIEQISGNFPLELLPLTSSINQLLLTESRQTKRYRDTLANLAHSIKTPLAIMKTEIQKLSSQIGIEQFATQLHRVDEIVRYQLNRSVLTQGQTFNRRSDLAPIVAQIVDALNKVHADKRLSIQTRIQADSFFPGESGDLMELVGNLADNACKWADTQVMIGASHNDDVLKIIIEDDGPGIPIEKRALILNRGKRLDQQAEGQGLGLSIVSEIVTNYQGKLVISTAALGGAALKLTIPLPK